MSRALLLGWLVASAAAAEDAASIGAYQFKHAEALLAQNHFEEAAREFIAFVAQNPKDELADSALYDAAVAYEQAGKGDLAQQLYGRVADEYPTSKLGPIALFRSARAAQPEEALARYRQLLKLYPAAKESVDAAFDIGVLLENLQRPGEAAAAFERYAKLYPNRGQAGWCLMKAARLYMSLGDRRAERQALETFLKTSSRKEAEAVSEAKKRLKQLEE